MSSASGQVKEGEGSRHSHPETEKKPSNDAVVPGPNEGKPEKLVIVPVEALAALSVSHSPVQSSHVMGETEPARVGDSTKGRLSIPSPVREKVAVNRNGAR